MIELCELTPDDWQSWRELRLQALGEAPYAFGSRLTDWQGDGDREDRWRNRLSMPGSYNLVALVDGEPAGMASGVPGDEDGEAELISMWVSPAARGRGVGNQLVAAVESWARRYGAGVLKLAVARDNPNARALYLRSGFQDTAEPGDLMPDGVRTEIVMAKSLSSD